MSGIILCVGRKVRQSELAASPGKERLCVSEQTDREDEAEEKRSKQETSRTQDAERGGCSYKWLTDE